MAQPGDIDIDTWAQAAAQADFTFYEVVSPVPDYRWAGGYGWRNTGETVELAINHDIGDSEVVVNTSIVDEDEPHTVDRSIARHRALHSLFRGVFDHTRYEPLPAVLEFTESKAVIKIDGVEVSIEGIQLKKNGEPVGWSGQTTVGGLRIWCVVRPQPIAGLELAPCTDWVMPDTAQRVDPG